MAVLVETQLSQLTRALDDTRASTTAAGYLHAANLHLFQNPIAISPAVPLSTFVAGVATFTGYAEVPIVWDVPGTADDGTVEVVSTPIIFRPTDAVTPNVIYGCFITDSGDTNWYFAATFDVAPLAMQTALQQIIVVVRYRPASNSVVITIS